jgi:hypothetical protein
MSKEVARSEPPARRRRRWEASRNTMSFPRELRDAIPDLPTCVGRVLELDSTTGSISRIYPGCPPVQLRMLVKETGKLKGEFPVFIDLQPEAARALAETLTRLADEADDSR